MHVMSEWPGLGLPEARVASMSRSCKCSVCRYEGVNRVSLSTIDTAAFLLVLDDLAPPTVTARASALLTGDGSNRWFDKALSVVAFNDGHVGFNAEHSWADALVVAHMWELTVMSNKADREGGYDADGHCARVGRDVDPDVFWPKKLKWDIPRGGQLQEAVTAALVKNAKSIADVDLQVVQFLDFGKGKVKQMRMSPDSFVQMAMQLAFFRDQNGKFGLTYAILPPKSHGLLARRFHHSGARPI